MAYSQSPHRSRPSSPSPRAACQTSARSWDAADGQRSVTVIVRTERAAPDGEAEGSVLLDREELEEMVKWETNELVRSLQEAEAAAGSSNEQAHQLGELQRLLEARQRDAERLRLLLDGQTGALGDARAQVTEQANIIQQQEERIQQLLRQLEGAHAASRGERGKELHCTSCPPP